MLLERKNILDLSTDELDRLIRAFAGIQKLPPDDYYSFFRIGGFHGEPFRGAGWGNAQWWGGYCNHGNILFPTWHRAYLLRLEQALQSIEGCEDVALPYWNQLPDGDEPCPVPRIFLQETYTYKDGTVEDPNPLYSYKFQAPITDNIPIGNFQPTDYSKPKGYETVRYPFSGLFGEQDIVRTNQHNAEMRAKGKGFTDKALQDNVNYWLHSGDPKPKPGTKPEGLIKKYIASLAAPNYTVFSNTTSAQKWNDDRKDDDGFHRVVALESPHNGMHLAVGGIEIPGFDKDTIPDANGDMGENETAGLDPIFFFHHCWIDLVFWKWQNIHRSTLDLKIIPEYPGTNSVDSQGPTPGVQGNVWLTLDSPLAPFSKEEGDQNYLTSRDVINIQHINWNRTHFRSYTYDLSKVDFLCKSPGLGSPVTPRPAIPHLAVYNVNKAEIAGSFVISAWTVPKPESNEPEQCVGYEPVLSRWHVSGCANCNNHLSVRAFFPLHGMTHEGAKDTEFEVRVHTRQERKGLTGPAVGNAKWRLTGKAL